MRKIIGTFGNPHTHWVGNGFPVRSLFNHDLLKGAASPFLLLDYAGPAQFDATTTRRGVGSHPHKGFETVTIVYQGEVEHRDSTGQGGVIGPGDVQWMTAGDGILHQEYHSSNFAKTGGAFEMIQLWVNLPAKDKGARPGYQAIEARQIPEVDLGQGQIARIIAGNFNAAKGPAQTFTPINMWDMRLKAGHSVSLPIPASHNVALVVLKGSITTGGSKASEAQSLHLSPSETSEGASITLSVEADTSLLVLSGEPIDEPVVMHGPFVMNTADEIRAAIHSFNRGGFGRIQA